ncbi:MAG: hypothetical protein JWQ25_1474 [Daejeonella sp.]|nr:hypothetical protein [Daejeonella sp.]
MRTNFLLAALFVFFNINASLGQETDIIENVTQSFRSENTQDLSKFLASTVELSILSDQDVYSKAQTEVILKDFITKHHITSVKTLHRLDSNPNYRFGVILMNTESGKFRVSFSMKSTSGKFLITEISIKNYEN